MDRPPPAYGDGHELLPCYSLSIAPNERSVSADAAYGVAPPVSQSSSADYVYSTSRMTLNLGRRVHGTSAPSYGRNALISGWLRVEDFKHAKQITITIWGKATIVVTDRGFPVFQDRRVIMLHQIVVWQSEKGVPRPTAPQVFPISYPLPTYARGRGTGLPPTMSVAYPGVEVEVRYSINLDMVRGGWHRHECTSTPFFFLPRCVPTSLRSLTAAFEEVEDKSEAVGEEVQWRMVDALRNVKEDGGEGTIVQFGLPLPLSYPAGVPIPFRISIITLAPLTAELIKSNIKVQLLRILSLTINKQRIRLDRTAGTATIWNVEAQPGAGIWEVTGSVGGGRPKGEMSWSLTGYIEVRYAIRLTLGPLEGLPTYRCEEVVQLVTDEGHDFDFEEAREQPALGLINHTPPYLRHTPS